MPSSNFLQETLFAPCVAFVARSGVLLNQLYATIARNTSGVIEGAVCESENRFLRVLERYEEDDDVKVIVMLGEPNGDVEFKVGDMIRNKKLTKPMIALFTTYKWNSQIDSSRAWCKYTFLRNSGVDVACTMDDLEQKIKDTFKWLYTTIDDLPQFKISIERSRASLIEKTINCRTLPQITVCKSEKQNQHKIGRLATYQHRLYTHNQELPTTSNLVGELGIHEYIWFKKNLPPYVSNFMLMCLHLTADHSNSISDANNKSHAKTDDDVVSSLCSGLLTIKDRFNGSLDKIAYQFYNAVEQGISPDCFIEDKELYDLPILGFGSDVHTVFNPDRNLEMLKNHVLNENEFKQVLPLLDFALKVERLTSSKDPKMILNLEGAIAIILFDVLRQSGMASIMESKNQSNVLNGILLLGHCIAFIGNHLDNPFVEEETTFHSSDDVNYEQEINF